MQCVGLIVRDFCVLSSRIRFICATYLTLPRGSRSSQAIAFPCYCLQFTFHVYKTVAVYLGRD
jgi:hypothetical protein